MTRSLATSLGAVFVIGAIGACYFELDAGRRCDTTNDCNVAKDFECVAIDGDDEQGVCLPHVDHERTTCTVDADCGDALFPVEAECEDGVCECILTPCLDFDAIVDRRRCKCVLSDGDPGEFCNDAGDCGGVLGCRDEQCTVPDQVGDACSGDFGCANGLGCFCSNADCTEAECGER